MSAQRNILLIEDEASDALLIKRAFEKAGFDFKFWRLKHGEEAINYLSGVSPFDDRETHPLPDVILLDIKLPRRTGFEVLEWLRSQPPGLSRIPVVMLTSSRHSVHNSIQLLCPATWLARLLRWRSRPIRSFVASLLFYLCGFFSRAGLLP